MSIINVEKDRMIDMLLSGINVTEIAKLLNVSRQTIYSWKKEKEVEAELETRREQLKKSAQDKITNEVCTYVDNMRDLACNSTDIRVKFQANKFLIEQCLGKAGIADDEVINTSTGKEGTDKNTLKAELEGIKNIRAIK
jgi:Transposase.